MDPDAARSFETRERALAARLVAFTGRLDGFLARRRGEGARFTREAGARLERLGFQKASLSAQTTERDPALQGPSPLPEVEFAFRPNAGEPPRALRRIASGGELSRVMLAIKSLMAERDRVAALVFDEVDQGIGGAVGEEVGRMLRELSRRRQVLCITHLPLIAAHGARHFEVVKSTTRGRTTTGVRPLTGKEREAEIARLLAGARVTDTTRRQARELLRAAQDAGVTEPERVRA